MAYKASGQLERHHVVVSHCAYSVLSVDGFC